VNTTNQYEPATHTDAISNGSALGQWSTFDAHFNKQQGTWRTERLEAVHQPIISQLFADKVPSQTQPRCDLLGGGFGVGKSRLARQMQSERPSSILIDADALKEFIPEYARFKGEDLDTAWLRVHDESRHIAQEVLAHAISGGFDVILDTCCSNSETAELLVNELKSHGYYLAMEFVDVPLEVAISRIKVAASVPGRAHYGRWVYGPETKWWQSPENPFSPLETWDFIADLFAGKQEFDAWRRLLPH
jgi:predicted ABC-type ATPase